MNNNNETNFVGFPKMARLSRECIITEKIDGTNAQVFIWDDTLVRPAGVEPPPRHDGVPWPVIPWLLRDQDRYIAVGSRNRWITPADDNYGFARWAWKNVEALLCLGHGRHFGEWWGGGIQRGYGLAGDDKRFSLFNVTRWCLHNELPAAIPSGDPKATVKHQDVLPACVGLVPVIWRGPFEDRAWIYSLGQLESLGSRAVPGYMKPEGIVVWHAAANVGFKITIENDNLAKSFVERDGRSPV